MTKRLFSLIIVPDSGDEVKTGRYNANVILGFFSILIVIFFTCLFIIFSYYIKQYREKNYINTTSTHRKLLNQVEKSNKLLHTLSEKLAKFQRNDKAFRLINSMSVIDDEMYKAGIGGHVIVDDSDYSSLTEDLQIKLKQIAYGLTSLDRQILIENNSFGEIRSTIELNRERIDNTPTILPTLSFRVTSGYGMRRHPITGRRHFHSGIDLGGSRGQPIFTTADGTVSLARYWGRLGKCIVIKHKYGYETMFGHLDKILVKVGQKVNKRDIIGTMGRTGRSTGIHLHYGVFLNNRSQNPIKYF